ncbi:MAG: UDP-2,3-diacylglucosamine diphosphatase [Gammaproteobacteria bacterium]|nr:UDP-2,3-diacylglucosamine diphosphatase [Gammaproteobacteria bacterium]
MDSLEQSPYLFDKLPFQPIPEWMSEPACEEPSPHCTEHRHHHSIWLSDVHLGTSSAKAELLCDFLKYNSCDTLYLVGDIIDGWRMKRRAYWPQEHINVIRRILTRSKRGTKIIYITGNHDEFLRRYSGMSFGNIHLVDEYIHHSPNGKKYWVVHGDGYDAVVFNRKWLAAIGDVAYESMLLINVWYNRLRSALGMDYWSLSSYLKYKIRTAFSIISNYEAALTNECLKRELDGVICGHIHHSELKEIDGVQYANCGDWVESCSALVEDRQGQLKAVKWIKQTENSMPERTMGSEMA